MRVLDEGHKYELTSGDVLTFIKRMNGELIHDGLTNEEVLEVLIDRMKYLQGKLACRENAIVITKLEESLMWLESRTKKRVEQGVETKDIPHKE